MKTYKSLIVLSVILVAAVIVSGCQAAAAPVKPVARQVEFEMVSHVTAEMPEQDVFVVKPAEADNVYRIQATEAADFMAAPVYAASQTVEHDPFVLGDNPFGPYPKGVNLGFTMEEWLASTGHGTYTVKGDEAELDLAFEKLVPDGVYTVWCATMYLPPHVKVIDEPCGAADGSANTFVANPQGKAEFHLPMSALPDSTDEVIKIIAIAYHSDGKTYGPLPGDFGLNSHVQLFFGLPSIESEAWQIVGSDGEIAHAH